MKTVPIILLIAGSVLLSSEGVQSNERPMCCQSRWCGACTCRRMNFKLSLEEEVALRNYLDDNLGDHSSKQSKTSTADSDYTPGRPKTSDDPKEVTTRGAQSDNTMTLCTGGDCSEDELSHINSFLPSIDCMMCKIAHC